MTYEKRLKIYWVAEGVVAHALWDFLKSVVRLGKVSGSTCVNVPALQGPPEDASLRSVRHSWEKRAFGFLYEHPSFAIVPEGELTPSESATIIYQIVTINARSEQPPVEPYLATE